MKKSLFASLLALVIVIHTPLSAAATEADLARLLGWFTGEFDNNEQVWQQAEDGVEEKERHEHIHHIFLPVEAPAIGEHVFFVKQYMDGDYENVYRQRLYKFSIDEDEQAIRLGIYSYLDEAKYRNTDQDPAVIRDIQPEELRNMPGCDVYWRYAEGEFIGTMKDKACFYFSERMGKNIYITDTLKLTEEEIWIGDKAYDEAGNKIFGRDEQHKNRKVRYFKGWAGIRNDRIDPESDKPEEMAFFSDLRLHNEGQILPLVMKDGTPSGYSIELARLTYQNTKVAVLKLALIEDATGKTFTYTWTNPGAERIGINLRWMQVGLTVED